MSSSRVFGAFAEKPSGLLEIAKRTGKSKPHSKHLRKSPHTNLYFYAKKQKFDVGVIFTSTPGLFCENPLPPPYHLA
jgi:hypothetical protein